MSKFSSHPTHIVIRCLAQGTKRMNTIKIRLDEDLSKGITSAMLEFHYSTKEEFAIDAIRQKLHDSKYQREKISAWQKLLHAPKRFMGKKIVDANEYKNYEYRPRFGLRDLLKHRLEKQSQEEEPKLWT